MAGSQGSAQKVWIVNSDEVGGGGGGGGLTQTQTQSAVTAAINGAADIDTLIARLGEIRDRNISGVPILFNSAALSLTGEEGLIDYSTGTRRVLRLSDGAVVGDAVFAGLAGASGLTQAQTEQAFEAAIDNRIITGTPVLFNSATLTLTGAEGILDYSTGVRRVLRLSTGAVVADAVVTSFAGASGITQAQAELAFEAAILDRIVTGTPVLFNSAALTLTAEQGILDYSNGARRVLRVTTGAVIADAVVTSLAAGGLTQAQAEVAFESAIDNRLITGPTILFNSAALTLTGEEGILDFSTGTRRVLRVTNNAVVPDAVVTGLAGGLTQAQAELAVESALDNRAVTGTGVIFTSTALGAGEYEGYIDHSTGTRQILRVTTGANVPDAVVVRLAGNPSQSSPELVEYALNSAPTVFIDGFAIRSATGAILLYSNYALTTLVTQGTNPTDAIAASIRPREGETTVETPFTTIANSTKIIEVPEPGDPAVAGNATTPFRPDPSATALSATSTALNGIPATATAVHITVWPDEVTRTSLGNSNQAYLAALSLIYTIDGSVPDWGTTLLAPNGIPLKYGDRLILSRADSLNLRVLSNSDTNTTTPLAPGRPQLVFYGLEGGTAQPPIYTPYDWSVLPGNGGAAAGGGGGGGDASEATLATLLTQGTPITGQALEAGGAGGTGWFSSIRRAITDRLSPLGIQLSAASVSVTPASDAQFRVVGNGAVLRQSLTRPNNTTAYAANSVWGGAFVFNTPYPAGTVVLPTDIEILMSNAANTTVFAIHILSEDLATTIPDGGVWAPPRTEIATKSFSFSGITFAAMTPAPGGTYSSAAIVDTKQSIVIGAGGNIVCYLVSTTSNTPVSQSVTTLKIGVVL